MLLYAFYIFISGKFGNCSALSNRERRWILFTYCRFYPTEQSCVSICTSLSPIQREFAPSFVNYKKVCTRIAATSDKVYQLLAHELHPDPELKLYNSPIKIVPET
jgi:hypothetical protein